MKSFIAAAVAAGLAIASFSTAAAEPIPAPLQAKVDTYKKKLVEWAAHPVIVAAVKEANAKGGLPGMTNSKWLEVEQASPLARAFTTSRAGVLVRNWEEDRAVSKLVVRDEKGNLVAASAKPLLYNNAARPEYVNGMKGQVWSASTVVPDPTGLKVVHASAPVKAAGKVIGVIQVGIASEY